MKISVFGLGYVGVVTAGCLSNRGHQVVGVDINPGKVATFHAGKSPILEPGLDTLLQAAHAAGNLAGTTDTGRAVRDSDVSIICVGTPSLPSGALDLAHIRSAAAELGAALTEKKSAHTLLFRSTMLPGSTRTLSREFFDDLPEPAAICYYPEFLREGTALADFESPALAVIGTRDGAPPPPMVREICGADAAAVDWQTAEMIKYACNAFHATKVSFANEMGRLAKHLRVDGRKVMELLCQDTKLNISAYYMRPGNPFGGSCLPKDVKALHALARAEGVELPVVGNLMESNRRHLESLLQAIETAGHKEVAILGLTFKKDTDDLRESPMVEIAQRLLGAGYSLRLYDPQLNLSKLMGSNKRVVDVTLPHLAQLLHADLKSALTGAGTIVAAQRCAAPEEIAACVTPDQTILDVNGWPELAGLAAKYEGFCW